MTSMNRILAATTFLMAVSYIDSFVSPAVRVAVPRHSPIQQQQRQQRQSRSLFMVTTSTETKEQQQQQQQAVMEELTSSTVVSSSTNGQVVESTTKEKEMTKTQQLMQQVKDAGTAGIISYALWELAFWLVSVPVVLFGYYGVMGHFPDLTDTDDLAKLGAEAFAFVNFARFAVPLRIGLALSTTPWIEANIVERYMKGNNKANNADKAENGSD